MSEVQGLVNMINKTMSEQRSKYHITLGSLIAALSLLDKEMVVEFDVGNSPNSLNSYRGYYEDLSMAPTALPRTVGYVLKDLKDALGKVFQGYKGGDFTMHEETPLWCATYGQCGLAIVGYEIQNGKFILITKEVS